MGRLSVEDKFFSEDSRWRKLAKIMSWDEPKTIGHLIFLWHSSQNDEESIGDGEDICDWSRLPDSEDSVKYLNALCHKRVRFCDLLQDGRYLIRGNKKNIDVLKAFRERAKRTNEKRRQRKIAELQGSERPTLRPSSRGENVECNDDSTVSDTNNTGQHDRVDADSKVNPSESQGSERPTLRPTQRSTNDTRNVECNVPPDDTRNVPHNVTRHTITTTTTNTNYKKNIYIAREGEGGEETDFTLSEKMPDEKPTEKKTKKKKTKSKTKTWSDDNRFSKVFSRLILLEPYKAVLDVPEDEKHLTRYMDDYDLSLDELVQISIDFFNYYESQQHKMKNPRSRMSTFCSNYAKRRNEQLRRNGNRQTGGNSKVDKTKWAKSWPKGENQDDGIPF